MRSSEVGVDIAERERCGAQRNGAVSRDAEARVGADGKRGGFNTSGLGSGT